MLLGQDAAQRDMISDAYAWKRFSPADGEYFFGYYDRNPWNHDQTLHLALKVGQSRRLPERGETAVVGVLDPDGRFEPAAVTRAWCHQQGCMQLFLPRRPNHLVYNDYEPAENRIVTRIHELGHGTVGRFEKPLYAISPDGRWGVSLAFDRIPRRGYSYADAALSPDRWPAHPEEDGIWLVDLDTGAHRLVASYREMIDRHPVRYGLEGQRLWLNHAIFNVDGSRILWLFRQCGDVGGDGCWWQTYLFTGAREGGDTECVLPDVYWRNAVSHQIWGRTPREILVDANWTGNGHEAVVFDESRRPWLARSLAKSHGGMAHLVFSPDGRRLLADTYPDREGRQRLYVVEVGDGGMRELGCFRHQAQPGARVDQRCDLHPRWSPDGRVVTVDSLDDGRRALYRLDLT